MKKLFSIISATIIALAMASCDSIDESERFGEAKGINPDRKVLVQEFTGQFCPNCPLGHEALDNIKKQYGENAVIVSIHAGDMAFEDEEMGLKTPDGDVYAKEWNIQSYPSAVVNRGSVMPDRSQWQGAVFMSGLTAPKVKIDLSAKVNDEKLDIVANLSADVVINNANLQFMIVEDNVLALQQDGEEYITDYVHNHVYRASPGGINSIGVAFDGNITIEQKDFKLSPKWNKDNLKVICYVYDDKEVLQAEEVKVAK